MPTSFENFARQGLQAALDCVGITFAYQGENYTAVQSDDTLTMPLDAGGFLTDYAFTLHCDKSDFDDTLPSVGATVTLDSKTYRILRVTTSAGDPGIAIDCGTTNK